MGKGANLYTLGYHYHGSINVITNFIRTGWLWEKVRMQGGAYGASVGFSKQSGIFTFTSYRDPNLLNTLDVYDQTADVLRAVRVRQARLVIVALPSATGGERVVSLLRQLYPQLRILARVPDAESVERLRAAGASAVVVDGLTTARDLAERAVLLYEPGEPLEPAPGPQA